MAKAPVNAGTARVMLTASGQKFGVPDWVLWGVYGVETEWGTNIATSSTGAKGAMQFEPATASKYGYPMTNTPNVNELQSQFDAAAHYLSDLKKQLGSWPLALGGYYAGAKNASGTAGQGYASKVVAKSKQAPPSNTPGILKPIAAAGNATASGENAVTGGVFDGLKAVGAFFEALLQHDTWVRIFKIAGGALLLYLGLKEFGLSPPIPKAVPIPV